MEKEDFLQPQVEQVLIEQDFINKYQLLASKFSTRDEDFKFDNNEILEIANSEGCLLKYSKSKEFHFEEKVGEYQFKYGFTLRFNSFDLGLSIINEKRGVKSAAPWNFLVKLMTGGQVKVPRVSFRNYEDVRLIVRDVFSIYNDIKLGILENQS